jgi:CRP/FNR family cyclic AMP-dependent transcriptional regulator
MVVLDKLDKVTFMRGLSNEYRERLISAGQFKSYQPEICIFHEGQSSAEVYLLAEGQVALETSVPGQGPMRVQTVSAGELLGWSPVLGQGVMTATARALTPCRVLALNAAKILAFAEEDPQFVLEFMRRTAITLAQRLNATRLQLLEAYGHEAHAVS